jgi:hypothetical protein
MQTITHTGTAILRYAWKKNYAIKSLKALQLELIFCSAMGKLTRQQQARAKKKARSYVYLLNYYRKRYTLSVSVSNYISK